MRCGKKGEKMKKGMSLIGILILIAVIVFGMIFGIKWVLVQVHRSTIKDKTEELVRFAQMKSDGTIIKEILERAQDNNIKIDPDSILIDREPGDHITISLSYTDSIVLPKKTLYFHFKIEKTGPLGE